MGFEAASDLKPERVSPVFVKIASICAILTGLSTIAVHWLPDLWSSATTFESAVQLRHNAIYMGRLWIVLIHCVLVVISMAAIPCLLNGVARLIAMFGFGCYVVFAFVESLRTSLSIFAVNRAWRAGLRDQQRRHAKTDFPGCTRYFRRCQRHPFFPFFRGVHRWPFLLRIRAALEERNRSGRRVAILTLGCTQSSRPSRRYRRK